MWPRLLIGVTPPAAFSSRRRLWQALEGAYPVTIRGCAPDERDDLAGLIAVGDHVVARGHDLPLLHVVESEALADEPGHVSFTIESRLDPSLRGALLGEDRCARPTALATREQVVLASVDRAPVWTAAPDCWHQTSAMLPDELGPDEVLRDRFRATRFLGLLPILELLRHVTADLGWEAPPLRAAFILDDPNLHWPSYGFADFAALADAAERHRFHTAMATVPVDTWFSDSRAVRLFGERSGLSLLMHGNDHLWCELGRELPEHDLIRLAAQAQRRIARFERRRGLKVARVMAPPHGACSEAMLRALRRTGFDAACISRPFPWLDRPPADALDAQWQMADTLAGCAPVLPRYALGRAAQDVVLRAYLKQPLILYGHHWDLSDGLEPLVEHAARINGLGDVRWMSLGEIAASNYLRRRREEVGEVRLLTRRARVELDPMVSRLAVHSAGAQDGQGTDLLEVREPGLAPYMAPLGQELRLRSTAGRIDLRLIAHDAVDVQSVAAPRWSPWPRARRLLVEGRDRARPVVSRISARSR